MNNNTKKDSVYNIYFRIILLALVAHSVFAVIFGILSIPFLTAYNICSIIFYIITIKVVKDKHFSFCAASVHIEVSLFVAVTTLYIGWEPGYSFYLIALCSLVYFCPYHNIYIPYFFSFAELLLFLLLKIYCNNHAPIRTVSPDFAANLLYLHNAVSCFAIILYAAFISNLSAVFTKRELMAKNQNLQTLLNHDELTQLYTRAYITESFHKNLDLSTPAFLIMADVDNFKHINDTYGHPCGDYVLFTLSTIMKTVCPTEAKISRWGGEEFVILLYNLSKEEAVSSIEKLRESIASYHFNFMSNEFSVTATFGISGTEESTSFDELVLLADNRMYYGKNSGKNTVISFS